MKVDDWDGKDPGLVYYRRWHDCVLQSMNAYNVNEGTSFVHVPIRNHIDWNVGPPHAGGYGDAILKGSSEQWTVGPNENACPGAGGTVQYLGGLLLSFSQTFGETGNGDSDAPATCDYNTFTWDENFDVVP